MVLDILPHCPERFRPRNAVHLEQGGELRGCLADLEEAATFLFQFPCAVCTREPACDLVSFQVRVPCNGLFHGCFLQVVLMEDATSFVDSLALTPVSSVSLRRRALLRDGSCSGVNGRPLQMADCEIRRLLRPLECPKGLHGGLGNRSELLRLHCLWGALAPATFHKLGTQGFQLLDDIRKAETGGSLLEVFQALAHLWHTAQINWGHGAHEPPLAVLALQHDLHLSRRLLLAGL
mmetsp:Transcript_88605/g.223134  ORF Transcript_88605/g.223134 Transcript_88605/m.223134 type:complete len:235 (+) Transcript_88605:322-1026(+)